MAVVKKGKKKVTPAVRHKRSVARPRRIRAKAPLTKPTMQSASRFGFARIRIVKYIGIGSLFVVALALAITSGVFQNVAAPGGQLAYHASTSSADAATLADDTQAEFDAGTYSNVQWNSGSSVVDLTADGKTAGSGNFTSSITNAGSSSTWANLAWTPGAPYGKELPSYAQTEAVYTTGAADMSGNVGLWHLNESSGTLADASGKANNGTGTSITYSATGKLNTGVSLNGTSSYIAITDNTSMTFGSAATFTFEGWYYVTSTSSRRELINRRATGGTDNGKANYALRIDAGKLVFEYTNSSGTWQALSTTSSIFSTSTWYHIAATVTFSSGADVSAVTFYVTPLSSSTTSYSNGSGASWTSGNGIGVPLSTNGTYQINLGRDPYTAGAFFSGTMDEVAIYNRILTSTELLNHYKRAALRLKYQVRSCNDSACSGESFVGPAGTTSDYYSELQNTSLGTPSFVTQNVTENQYFQYKAFFETDNASYTPQFTSVSVLYGGYVVDSTQTNFNTGTRTYTTWSTDHEELSTADADQQLPESAANDGYVDMTGNIALWHLNESSGNFVDTSGNSNTATASNMTYSATGLMNTAVTLNGSTSNAVLTESPVATSTNLTTGSVFAWVKTTTAGSGYRGVVVKQNAYGIFLRDDIFIIYDWGAGTPQSSGVDVTDNTWHQIGITFQSGVSNGTKLYVDGVLKLTTTMTVSNQNEGLTIGAGNNPAVSQYFGGTIDEAAVWNRVLSGTEILTIYNRQAGTYINYGHEISAVKDAAVSSSWNSIAWVPSAPYGKEHPGSATSETAYASGNANMTSNVGLWHMNQSSWNGTSGEVVDSSGSGNNGTASGGATTTASGKFSRAGTFDGINDYVNIGTGPTIAGNLTWSGWIKTTYAGIDEQIFGAYDTASPYTGWGIGFATGAGNAGKISFWSKGASQPGWKYSTSATYNTGDWIHVAVTLSGSTYTFYKNGVADGTGTSVAPGSFTGNKSIGANSAGGTPFTGQIDEVAIFSRALSATEILNHYKRGVLRMKFQVRSCDDASCSGETFMGPDGTSTDYYDELDNSAAALPTITLTNVPNNRYFQYKAFYEIDNATYTPQLTSVTVSYTALGISIAGTVYTDEESTAMTTTPTVRVKVNGAGSFSAAAAANGTYTVSSITQPSAGDVITVYLDDETEDAVLVTRYSSGNLTSINLYQNRVIIRHEDPGPVTNVNLNQYDSACASGTGDADIQFCVDGGNLTVSDGAKLLIWTGDTFTPGGTVTTSPSADGTDSNIDGDVEIQSSGVLSMEANALSVGGDFTNGGTFSESGSPQVTTFTATATGHSIDNGTGNLDNVTFNGSGGGWSFADASNTIAGDVTMTAGTLSGTNGMTVNGGDITGDGTITMTGGTVLLDTAGNFGGATAWTFNNITFGDGSGATQTTTTGSGGVTVSGVLTIAASQTLDAKGKTWTLSGTTGTPFVITGTFNDSTDTSTFAFTGNYASGDTTIPSSTAYNHLTVNNASETYVLGGHTTTSGNVTITAGTLDATATPYNLTVAGNFANSGTFTARTGMVTLNGSAQQVLSGTLTGSSAFYKLTITNTSGANASDCERTGFTPSVDFNAAATVTNDYTITTPLVRVEYNSGSTYTFANINWAGTAGNLLQFRNSAGTGTWSLNVTGTQTAVSYVNVSRSDASGWSQITATDGTNTNCSNNTNWQFTAGYRTSGYFISSTFNTQQTSGVAYNTLLWTGTEPTGTNVKMQIATSNCSNGATNAPTCNSGAWGATGSDYLGSDCTSGSYYISDANTAIEVKCYSNHNNKQYFKYKVILESDSSATPTVTGVVVNYSQ